MKCEECRSSLVYFDDTENVAWCKTCGYTEILDFKSRPTHLEVRTERQWLIKKLKDWSKTFDDEDKEPNKLLRIIIKLANDDELDKDDYDEILFHLWQISEGDN